jgi:hypothetical protein
VVARLLVWAHGNLSLFIMSGADYSHPAQMYPAIGHVPKKGYDGQFYYRFALNPVNWRPTAYGITIDHSYRYTRIGYSVAAWAGSLGGHGALLPYLLLGINVGCVAVMAWLGATFARESGRHALWGLLLAAYFGLVISVGRDTSEPLADACMLGGLLAYRRARYVLAALLIGYGVFANEPILVVAAAIAVTRLSRPRRWLAGSVRPDLAWALPLTLYLLLQAVQRLVVRGTPGGEADVSANLTLPFKAMVPRVYRDVAFMTWTHLGTDDYNLIEFLALAAFITAGFLVLRSTTAPVHERVAFAGFVLIELVMASKQFWNSTFGDGRTYIDAYLMAVVLLFGAPAGRVVTGRRLGALAAVAAAALILVARRRILFE